MFTNWYIFWASFRMNGELHPHNITQGYLLSYDSVWWAAWAFTIHFCCDAELVLDAAVVYCLLSHHKMTGKGTSLCLVVFKGNSSRFSWLWKPAEYDHPQCVLFLCSLWLLQKSSRRFFISKYLSEVFLFMEYLPWSSTVLAVYEISTNATFRLYKNSLN